MGQKVGAPRYSVEKQGNGLRKLRWVICGNRLFDLPVFLFFFDLEEWRWQHALQVWNCKCGNYRQQTQADANYSEYLRFFFPFDRPIRDSLGSS